MQIEKTPIKPAAKREGLARVEEAARYLAIGRTTIYELLDSGALPSVKIGKARRIPWTALEKLASAEEANA